MADSQFADLGVPLTLFVIGLQLTQILYQLAPFVLMKGSGPEPCLSGDHMKSLVWE